MLVFCAQQNGHQLDYQDCKGFCRGIFSHEVEQLLRAGHLLFNHLANSLAKLIFCQQCYWQYFGETRSFFTLAVWFKSFLLLKPMFRPVHASGKSYGQRRKCIFLNFSNISKDNLAVHPREKQQLSEQAQTQELKMRCMNQYIKEN